VDVWLNEAGIIRMEHCLYSFLCDSHFHSEHLDHFHDRIRLLCLYYYLQVALDYRLALSLSVHSYSVASPVVRNSLLVQLLMKDPT